MRIQKNLSVIGFNDIINSEADEIDDFNTNIRNPGRYVPKW